MPVHRGNGAVGQLLVHSLVKEQGLVELQVIEGSILTTTAEEEGWKVVDNCIPITKCGGKFCRNSILVEILFLCFFLDFCLLYFGSGLNHLD